MALAKVNTIWSGTVVGGGLTQTYFSVTPLDVTSAQQCIDAMRDFWTALSTNMSVSTSWTVSGSVQEINPATGQVVAEFGVLSRVGAGGVAGDVLPPANQGLLRLRTATFVSGRRIQGHINIPGAMESLNGPGGTPTAAYLTTLGNAGTALAALVNPSLHVYSRKNFQSAEVFSTTAIGMWAVLRSRRD